MLKDPGNGSDISFSDAFCSFGAADGVASVHLFQWTPDIRFQFDNLVAARVSLLKKKYVYA